MFDNDLKKGRKGELAFIADFLELHGIQYRDVAEEKEWQPLGVDFIVGSKLYEVKASYRDQSGYLIIEELSDVETGSKGWFDKTIADVIVFIDPTKKSMIFLLMTDELKAHYNSIRGKHPTIVNEPSGKNGNTWRSSYKRIPINDLKDFCWMYKKLGDTSI